MDEQYRRAATNSGSAVAIAGLLYFFFATDAATHLSLGLKCLAAFISIAVTLVCVRLYFRSGEK